MSILHKSSYASRVTTFALLVTILAAAGRSPAATPGEVQNSIDRTKNFLYGKQSHGIWDVSTKLGLPPGDNGERAEKWMNWGGITALITHSLLVAGESPNDPRIKSALDFLKSNEFKGTYAIAIRAQVWADLPQTAETRTLLKKDVELLQASMFTKGINKGLWDYFKQPTPDGGAFDHSNSQYALLALWAAADTGVEVRTSVWQLADEAWRKNQHPSGTWSYRRSNAAEAIHAEPRFTITGAGIATLFLTNDFLNPGFGINCKGNIQDANIEKGLTWLGDHMDDMFKVIPGGQPGYEAYTMERVGVASGRKYFGKTDWFQFAADNVIQRQNADGGWYGDPITAAFNLMFLVHGRAPVVINKLQWELPKSSTPAGWNQRPRDAANFVRWMGKQLERPLNWQIVNLQMPVDELHDAPILLIAGSQVLKFSDDDIAKLRTFVEQGGLILGNSDCGNGNFSDSFRKLGSAMFPAYEFRELPADHVIYTGEQYQRAKWKNKPSVLALSNGVRELMILAPTADMGKSWQLQDHRSKVENFQLASNLVLYASEGQSLRSKGESYLVPEIANVKTDRSIRLARLQYAGNWDPEPGGWRRLAKLLRNKLKIDLQVETIKLGEGKLDSSFKLAHLTGTAAFKLTSAQQDELKKFLADGGTLLIDSAGGSAAFATSAESEIATIVPGARAPFAPLPATNPIFAGLKDLSVRKFAAKSLGKTQPNMPAGIEQGGRVAVFFSPVDISGGLVGQPIDGITGYSPDSTAAIVTSIVEQVGGK